MHILYRGCGELIFIVKTNDNRLCYLKSLLEEKNKILYQNTFNYESGISEIVLPMGGIDQFGYISGTNIRLDKILENNTIDVIYTGKVSDELIKYSKLFDFKISSFYKNEEYLKKEFLLKIEVVKAFLEDKFDKQFRDLKIIIVGNDYMSYLLSEKLNCAIYDRGSISSESVKDISLDIYDAYIVFDYFDINVYHDRLIVDMCDKSKCDLSLGLCCNDIYYIEQLLTQYLTKSGGKLMYDSMVNR